MRSRMGGPVPKFKDYHIWKTLYFLSRESPIGRKKLASLLGIGEGECTADGKFSLDSCRCVGACGLAPVMMINDDVYGRLTPDQVPAILAKY